MLVDDRGVPALEQAKNLGFDSHLYLIRTIKTEHTPHRDPTRSKFPVPDSFADHVPHVYHHVDLITY